MEEDDGVVLGAGGSPVDDRERRRPDVVCLRARSGGARCAEEQDDGARSHLGQ
jgi:hypothetical protein